MRRFGLFLVIALIAASCNGGTAETTTTSSTEATTTTTSSTTTTTTTTVPETTTTTLPPSPVIAREGDKTSIAAAVQYLLECLGYADLTIDGSYGPATTTAVEAAQTALGMAVTGDADENLFAALSISCPTDPPVELGDEPTTVIGYTTAGAPAIYPLALLFGSTLVVTPKTGAGVVMLVKDAEGNPVVSEDGVTFPILTTGDYTVEVSTEADPVVFTMDLFVDAGAGAGDWIITTDGISYKGTKFGLGAPAGPMITKIFEFLGHNVRSSFGEFDTGWDDPTQEGFRGIFIEGMAFLFYGPTAANPGIPETFGRVRYVGPSFDKDGNPRPAGYVQTLSGITVGNTLAELVDTYGSILKSGSDTVGHYRRYPAANGDEVCFYFGKAAPTDSTKITEISTECRG